MYLCDSNIWVALALSHHLHHGIVRAWLDSVEIPHSILMCRASQNSFLRLLTYAPVLARYGMPPLTNQQAWDVCDALFVDDRIVLVADEPPGLGHRWRELTKKQTASPKLWMDAYLAAFAASGGYRLVTTDRAFHQFNDPSVVILEGATQGRTPGS